MINELELLENKIEREKLIERIEVLDKVKKVILLPFGDFMTNKEIADYYEVGVKAINSLILDNKEELESNGYHVYKGNDLCKSHVISFKYFTKNRANYKFYSDDGDELSVGGKGIGLFTVNSIFKVGLLLQDSNISRKLKKELGLLKKVNQRKEILFLDKLEKTLKPFNLTGIRQYNILNYRIDYYISQLNMAIEYDENGHADYTYEQHEGRQKEIEKELGCKFIRVNDKNSDEYNIGVVLKEIFNI